MSTLRLKSELMIDKKTLTQPKNIIVKTISRNDVFFGSKVIETKNLKDEVLKMSYCQTMSCWIENQWLDIDCIIGDEIFLTSEEIEQEIKTWKNN